MQPSAPEPFSAELSPSHDAEARQLSAGPPGEIEPESPEFSDALVTLLEEQLSLVMRARRHILHRLQERYPDNGHDLWEWRKVLDTYPLPRLLHLLRSQSPMALRLRRSSPFPAVLSERERERLQDLLNRPH